MNLKQFKILVITLFVGGLVFTACEDKFSEEDFLNKQYSLDTAQQAKQVAALNEAGKLLSFSVQVLEDGSPVADVDVTISNATGTGTTTVKTGASGVAIFSEVAIGGNTVIISKAGYITASVTVDFGSPQVNQNWSLVNNRIVPIKRNASLQVPIFTKQATAAGSTAVIKGSATMETDVTNIGAEKVPDGTIIRANFAGAIPIQTTGQINNIGTYFFTEGELGKATVTNGAYSMIVPAISNGSNITLDIPNVEGKLRVAVNTVNSVDADNIGPEYRDVDAVWGPGMTYDAVPDVVGVLGVVTPGAPSVPGRGFSAAFTPVGRSLDGGTIDDNIETLSNTTYAITNRGSGYTASPTVDISGIAGTDDAETTLRGLVSKIEVTAGGAGYPVSTAVRIHLAYNNLGSSDQFAATVQVTTTAAGALPIGVVTLPATTGFIGNNPFVTTNDVQSFKIAVTDLANAALPAPSTIASITIDRSIELNSIIISNTGSGFTSAPTITLAGGTTGTGANVSVLSFRKQFDIALGSAATTPYKILPSGISFFYPTAGSDAAVTESPAKVDRVTPIGFIQNNSADFISMVTTNGTNLVALEPTNTLRTDKFWAVEPVITVKDATLTTAKVTAVTVSNGTVTGVTATAGAGYDAPISLAIMPLSSTAIAGTNVVTASAPGSGATVSLTAVTNNVTTKAYSSTTGTAVQTVGSNYIDKANQKIKEDFSVTNAPGLTVNVKSGNTYVVDIKYGTGDVKVDVQ
jgi:hypothetical protein